MNREAAALGVPVYSIFRGKTGAIDRQLQKEGRLVMVETTEEADQKIKLARRTRNGPVNNAPPPRWPSWSITSTPSPAIIPAEPCPACSN